MKEKKKTKKIIVLCILIPVLLFTAAVAGVAVSLVSGYIRNAYEGREIEDRSEEYVEPSTNPDLWGVEETTAVQSSSGSPSDSEKGGAQNVQDPDTVLYKKPFDYDVSFGDSPNAISVYGKTPIYRAEQKDPDVINILVLGTDSRNVTKERGRSDSIIVLSYNKRTGKIKMVSVLRDSLVPIEGHNWNRINAAYSFDGVGLAVNTVNELFDLDIQHFVVIDFNGARNFVDKVGGVEINLTQKEADFYNHTGYMGRVKLKEGPFHMNGERALVYMRTRYVDNDFKRTERQRNVIVTLAKKIINEKSLAEIYDLTNYSFTLVKTNISVSTLLSFVTSIAMKASSLSIDSQHVPFSDDYSYEYYNGMAIISFDIDSAAKRVNEYLYS
ncbi:MAG: LCP family protein [Clostridia bacterium]|nr:LCP family protein [Clostridia bacterium]